MGAFIFEVSMLVRIEQNKDNPGRWDVTSLGSIMYGGLIATTDCARIHNPRFQTYSITGFLHALHGADLNEEVYEHPKLIRAINLSGVFKPCHRQALLDSRNTGWFDKDTLETLVQAHHLNAMGTSVWYSSLVDVAQDRAANTASVQAPDDPKHWSVGKHLKIVFRKLMGS